MSVSIIIPHKNSAKKLIRLIDTIPEYFEVIIVDDGSCEEDRRGINFLSEKENITLVDNQGPVYNAGVSRNLGLSLCNSEWIIFSDADDYFFSENLRKLEAYLSENGNADIIFFQCLAKNEDSQSPSRRCDRYNSLIKGWPANSDVIAYEWVVPWGKAIRREVVDRNNISFASRIAGNDVEFSTDLASLSIQKEVFESVVYVCSESSSSLTATKTPEKSLSRLEVGFSRNRKLYSRRILIHYDYNVNYFISAFPILLKSKRFDLFYKFIFNFFLSFYMNIIYPNFNFR